MFTLYIFFISSLLFFTFDETGKLNEILSFGTGNMIDEQYLTHLTDKIAEQTWKELKYT